MSLFASSVHSDIYASFRPAYPESLFEKLASMVPGRGVAWDVGCGSGQATSSLANYFDHVIGTDLAQSQLDFAIRKENILYVQCSAQDYPVVLAEKLNIKEHSVDLVTVAQALHWMDMPAFFANVRHFLKPDTGFLAIISYNWPAIEGSVELSALVMKTAKDVLNGYWAPQRAIVDDHYRDVEFPFSEVIRTSDHPFTTMTAIWTLDTFYGYCRSWSSYQTAAKITGQDPLEPYIEEITKAWGDEDQERTAVFPTYLQLFSTA